MRKVKSIIQGDLTRCFFWDDKDPCDGVLEAHHVVYGYGRRKISDREGLIVMLCQKHHRGTNGVHENDVNKRGLKLKKIAQETWEAKFIEEYPYENHAEDAAREAWIKMMGCNYL